MNRTWDLRFLDLTRHIATWSKDPSTQVGAVIVNKNKKVVSLGFNGFPSGVLDAPNRYLDKATKHSLVVHAEANAILTSRCDLSDCTIYASLFTCNECAKLVVQSGIKRVVSYKRSHPSLEEAWAISKLIYKESGVEVVFYD